MGSELHASLPWDQLSRRDDIPWSALHTFANAVVADRELTPKLFELYDRAFDNLPGGGAADILVPGVFALAARELDEPRRQEIGSFLIERIAQAGQDDDFSLMEVLTAAAGTMGPAILPAALDAVHREPNTNEAWPFLWDLTLLAAKTDDQELRGRVIRACVEQLECIEKGPANPADGIQAAWTLATLKCTEYADLIQQIIAKSEDPLDMGDYEYALQLLQDRLDFVPVPQLWEEPVEEWLIPRYEDVYKWEDEEDDYEEDEFDEDNRAKADARLMVAEFCKSAVAEAMPRELRNKAPFLVQELIYNSLVQLGLSPHQWDESAMRELLLDIMPRKLLTDFGDIEVLVPITETLLYWLHFEGGMTGKDALARTIHDWTDRVVAAGYDRKNWGPNKQFVMEALEAGLDPTDPQRMQAFQDELFRETDKALSDLTPRGKKQQDEPPIPIVEHRAKIARNAPCPCGSGRKYKKCCGRSETNASAD